MKLAPESRVVVLGGGPGGAFFAIHLLEQARQAGLDIQVSIIDKKIYPRSPDCRNLEYPDFEFRGCNYCAGIISPRLNQEMKKIGIQIPRDIVMEEFTRIWIHGLWKNFPLKISNRQKILSVFRGNLPPGRSSPGNTKVRGFDGFLLNIAGNLGAVLVGAEAQKICHTQSRKPSLTLLTHSGETRVIESDFLAICTGVNPGFGVGEKKVSGSHENANSLSVLPRLRQALVFELRTGRDYLRKYMNREIYFIVSGSKRLDLDHITLVPKQDYLTVALVGKRIDQIQADPPGGYHDIIHDFLHLPQIRTILPGLDRNKPPVACVCRPYMAIQPSKSPISHRRALAGDAMGSRLYRDGLFSAFVSGKALAHTLVHEGVDQTSLWKGYGPTIRWLKRDNRYGWVVNLLMQTALKSPVLSRVIYQTFATEMKRRPKDKRPLGDALLGLGSGFADYEQVFWELFSFQVFVSILRGGVKTIRNKLTEIFFGLNWDTHGRYPTVILKEKRKHFKQAISAPLGIQLEASPEMERMYAIKIRAPAARIFKELGKFGDRKEGFLNLRFVQVRRIRGLPNQAGSVIQYQLKHSPFSMNLRLEHSIPDKTLWFAVEKGFAENGCLVFDIASTNDGNNRLVVYAAFDFKRSVRFPATFLWAIVRRIFPDYAHDVVWNHAVCSIKKAAEQAPE